MTIPVRSVRLGQSISEVRLDDKRDWRSQHQDMLYQAYFDAPFRDEMLALVRRVHERPAASLADVTRASIVELASYFDLERSTVFIDVENLGVSGNGSRRVLDVVLALGGDRYVTGHGAKNYLDHAIFEQSSIAVEYMDYRFISYPQLHGPFTPYVSALDLIANCGSEGLSVICSSGLSWREFMKGSAK